MKKAWLASAVLGGMAAVVALGQDQPRQDPQRPNQPDRPNQPTDRAQDPAQRPDQARQGQPSQDQLSQPGAEHQHLNAFVGSWQVTGQCWKPGKNQQGAGATRGRAGEKDEQAQNPGQREPGQRDPAQGGAARDRTAQAGGDAQDGAQSVNGTCESKWVLGRRFIQSAGKGTEGGEAFEILALCGYDNAQRKYVSTKADSKCTSIKVESGSYDPASKTFTYTGDFRDENGRTVRCRTMVKIVNDNEHRMISYITEPGGEEMKVAELTFKRTGAAGGREGQGS